MNNPIKPATKRAVEALKSLLMQVSSINVKDIRLRSPFARNDDPRGEVDILAHIEVFGHDHTLACQISGGNGPHQVQMALDELRRHAADLPGNVTSVVILPVVSPEVQALCYENKTGCLDLQGNGRLMVDEIFISMRSLPRRTLHRSASSYAMSSLRPPVEPADDKSVRQDVIRGFPIVHAEFPHRGSRTA